MNFNSPAYLVFLPVTAVLYFLAPERLKNLVLLLASFFFYMYRVPAWGALMLLTTAVTWVCALAMRPECAPAERRGRGLYRIPLGRRGWLGICLGVNLGILFFFKYAGFLAETLNRLPAVSLPVPDILLPAGISFYTLQTAGYCIDVYRRELKPERSFIDYAVFVSFFPQLVAGPIERGRDILPQLKRHHAFRRRNLMRGGLLILTGLAKKMILADNLGVIVDRVYGSPVMYSGPELIFATACFTVQLFCDFSGYTDIARGSARIFGIVLTENFPSPFRSESVREFWRRWHASLSRWFHSCVYIPLGGNRHGRARQCLAVLAVFLLSGFWHGAALHFAAWGLLNGLFETAGILTDPVRERVYEKIPRDLPGLGLLRRCFTGFLFSVSMVFFRGESLHDSLLIYRRIFQWLGRRTLVWHSPARLGTDVPTLVMLGVFCLLLFLWGRVRNRDALVDRVSGGVFVKYAAAAVLTASLLLFGYYGEGVPSQAFVYFQF